MWFCQKCNKWYCDSVTILKHFETRHAAAASTKASSAESSNTEPGSEGGKDLHILKPTLAKLLKVKKKRNSQLNNGVQEESSKSEICQSKIKKCAKADDDMKTHMKKQSFSVSEQTLPKNVGVMHITNKKDSGSIDQVMIVGKVSDEGILSKIKTFICKYCCRRFPNSELLQAHLKTHQGKTNHACHICGITAGTFSALMAHYVKHSGLKTLNVSSTPNETKILFREPEAKKETEKKQFYCNQCKKHFISRRMYNTHYCPPVSEKSEYVCVYCRQVTTSVEEYRDHIQSHSPSYPFACKYCSRKFGHKVKMQQHMKVCLKKPAESPKPTSKRAVKASNERPPKIQKTSGSETKTGQVSESNCSLEKQKVICSAGKVKSIPVSEDASNSVTKTGTALVDGDSSQSSISYLEKYKDLSVEDERADPSPLKSIELMTIEGEDDIHQRLRPKKPKVTYASDSSPEVANTVQPTRRSARLVNRKHLRFSRMSSESENEDKKHDIIELPSSPVAVNSAEPLNPPLPPTTRRRSSCSPKKDEAKLRSSPSRSPRNKPTAQRSPTSVSPKKCSIRPKRSPTKRKRRIVKVELEDEDENTDIGNQSNTLYCNQCSLIFRSAGSLKRHKKMHTGKPQFVCQFCGKFFYRRDIHRRHESNVHQGRAPASFGCYYCKCVFPTSADLKEHAYEAHSGRAAAPERIRRCTPKSAAKAIAPRINVDLSDDDTTVTVKKEIIDATVEEESLPPKAQEPLSYKCGKCDKVFDEAQNLVKHYEEAHSEKESLRPPQVEKPEKVQKSKELSCSKKAVSPCFPKKRNSKVLLSTTETEPPLPIMKSLPRKITKLSIRNDTVSDKTFAKENIASKNEDYPCSVCFTLLPEKGTMMCTEPQIHKAVDWYQCLLCSVSGSKQHVLDHMLHHMTKIGTFVVNVQDSQFKVINDCLYQKNSASSPFDRSFEQAHSVCTLMEEVICSRCSESIIDFSLLIHHPCRDTDDGGYSCFVKDCNFLTDCLTNFENHLQVSHYHQIHSSVRTPLKSSTSSFQINGCTGAQNIMDIKILNNMVVEQSLVETVNVE